MPAPGNTQFPLAQRCLPSESASEGRCGCYPVALGLESRVRPLPTRSAREGSTNGKEAAQVEIVE